MVEGTKALSVPLKPLDTITFGLKCTKMFMSMSNLVILANTVNGNMAVTQPPFSPCQLRVNLNGGIWIYSAL